MGLRGQARRRHVLSDARGYAMAALLVMLAVIAILMTVAMPVWRQQARREQEAELVFRGEQYARAIALYRYKNAQVPNALPPSIDVLVDGRYLRKKFKDPMSKDGEFVVIPPLNPAAQPTFGAPFTSPAEGYGEQDRRRLQAGPYKPASEPPAGSCMRPVARPLPGRRRIRWLGWRTGRQCL